MSYTGAVDRTSTGAMPIAHGIGAARYQRMNSLPDAAPASAGISIAGV